MPIYEYNCLSCGYQYETLQKINDEPLVDCPSCQQPTLKKMLSAAGFRLSGSGWYETDFKNKKVKDVDATPSSESKPSASGSADQNATSKATACETSD